MAKPKPVKKTEKRKSLGKGVKAFLALFVLTVITIALWGVMKAVNKNLVQSLSMTVQPDLEVASGTDGKPLFKEPWGIAVDGQGNFYVTDFGSHNVRKFDPNGGLLLTLGEEGKEPGQFNQPSGIFVDSQGILYVNDTFNHRVQKFDAEGTSLKSWNHGFFGPRSLTGDNRGHLYVVDTGNHKVQAFDTEGNFQREWGGMGTANGKFQEPVGSAVDPQGNLYVADSDNLRVQKFDPNGKFLSSFQVATWRGKNVEVPYLAIQGGFLYATNASEGAVLKYTLSGKLKAIYRRKEKGGFVMPSGLAVDSQNRVYVVEKQAGKVTRFLPPTGSAPPK